jgi:tetratricopeptide (TPR) repeat protein
MVLQKKDRMKNLAMKTLKLTLSLSLGLMFFGTVNAQKYGATPEDSLECIKNLSVYSGFYKHKSYKDAVASWKKACEICPKSSKNLYLRGAGMYRTFMNENKANPERVEQLFDTLMWIYDRRIEHFGQEGYVLGRKGSDMLNLGGDDDVEPAYETLLKSFELQGSRTEPGVLVTLYMAQYKMYKDDKVKKEDLLELYPKLMDVVDANRSSKKPKTAELYLNAEENLAKMFAPVADCPDLIQLFEPKFNDDSENLKLNKNIIKLMDAKNCEDSDLYIKVAVKLNEQEPTANSAFSIGKWYLKKAEYTNAIQYFVQAAELGGDDVKLKEDAYYRAAASALGARDYPKVRELCRKLLQVNPNNGEAYILIGDAYSGASKTCGENECEKRAGYWAAYDQYLKAKSVDPSLAEKVGTKLGAVKAQFPKQADCFFYGIQDGAAYQVGCWIGESTTVRVNE